MSLSSLKEIKLDFSWVRGLFVDEERREKNVEETLQLDILPNKSWILDLSYGSGELVKYCAKKWPNLNFVVFNQSTNNITPPNIYTFNLTLDEFASNSNEDYDNLVVKNRVGYRRVIMSYTDTVPQTVFERIDKQLFKDYGNAIKSLLVIYACVGEQIKTSIPYFKEIMSSIDHEFRFHIFRPISDFNN
jgi:hypothetical protein